MTDEEQERHLDDGLKSVKAQSYHIKSAIEQNNMRRCLRETSAMCLELKTSLLTPKSYYNLMKCNMYLISLKKKLEEEEE